MHRCISLTVKVMDSLLALRQPFTRLRFRAEPAFVGRHELMVALSSLPAVGGQHYGSLQFFKLAQVSRDPVPFSRGVTDRIPCIDRPLTGDFQVLPSACYPDNLILLPRPWRRFAASTVTTKKSMHTSGVSTTGT